MKSYLGKDGMGLIWYFRNWTLVRNNLSVQRFEYSIWLFRTGNTTHMYIVYRYTPRKEFVFQHILLYFSGWWAQSHHISIPKSPEISIKLSPTPTPGRPAHVIPAATLKDSNTMGSIEPPKKCSSTCLSGTWRIPGLTDPWWTDQLPIYMSAMKEGNGPFGRGPNNPTFGDNNDHHGYKWGYVYNFLGKKKKGWQFWGIFD